MRFWTRESVTGHQIDRAGRSGHGMKAHEKLEILQWRTGGSLTEIHEALEVGQIRDQMSGSLSPFAVSSGQQEDLSGLTGILHESNDGKRFPGSKPTGAGRVNGQFVLAGMDVLDDLLVEILAENKTKVQLVPEDRGAPGAPVPALDCFADDRDRWRRNYPESPQSLAGGIAASQNTFPG